MSVRNWSVAVIALVFIGLAVTLEYDRKPASPTLSSSDVVLLASTNFNPNGYYGAYEPAVGLTKTRAAIMVSKFVTPDNTASMGLIRPTSAGLYGPTSNLMAVCVGSNWWWYAPDLDVSSVPAGSFFGIDQFRYRIGNPAIPAYKVYPEQN